MIEATMRREGSLFSLKIQGHAEYATRGQDLVCAAVSAVAYGLADYINQIDRAGLTLHRPETRLSGGGAMIKVRVEKQAEERMEGAFELSRGILALLSENYPENIQISHNG